MALAPFAAARLFGCTLMIHPAKAEIIARAFASHLVGSNIYNVYGGGEMQLGGFDSPLEQLSDREVLNDHHPLAVIAVEGTLVHKGAFIGQHSGATSYEGLFRQIRAARENPLVKGVLFEFDSPGGEVHGCFDLADEVAALSTEKPTFAVLNDFAYSAAYLLASACRHISISETGGAGSIGAVYMHQSIVRALDKDGIDIHVFRSGTRKMRGNPYETLDQEFIEKVTGEVEAMGDLFADRVGKFRAGRISKEKALTTQADTFSAQEALEIGLVDIIARPSAAYEDFKKFIESGE